MDNENTLKMSFDPHTIEHLGVKMYSNIPNAIAELIANAYDADASEVWIKLYEDENDRSIHIIDNGDGMSFDEVNDKFLRIGRKRREEESEKSLSGERIVTGKKGLGKLAFFGIGDIIEIETIKNKSGQKIVFTLDWNALINTHEKDYKPIFSIHKCDSSLQGTTIKLKELKRKSPFDLEGLAVSLSRLFNLFDNTFSVFLTLNDYDFLEVDEKLKFQNIQSQFEWKFPESDINSKVSYLEKDNVRGLVVSTEKPLKPGLRGITLFANGRLVNVPEFFGVSESSHGFSYIAGWLDVDFVDNWKEDVISTDRQSLNWDLTKTTELREYLKKTMSELERSWREKRNEKRKEKIKETTSVDVADWYNKLPKDILDNIEPIINTIIDKSELENNDQSNIVQKIHTLVPEYPYYHWRHLNQRVQDASRVDYINEDYYRAFIEAAKRYINEVRNKSRSSNQSDSNMMSEVFGSNNPKIAVTKKFKKPDGSDFQESTKNNIENGQKFLSMGIVTGGRNPVSHEEVSDLRDSGLFSEKDCLDALSLLSHLFRRLENI